VVAVNIFSGQRAWLLQRVSAIILLAVAIVGMLVICQLPALTFAHWRTLAASSTGATFILVGYVAACVHAWVGARDVALDYLSHKGLRLLTLTVIGVVLIATLIRVLVVLVRLA
jgi:succinate dehydrogenase / fumarate reductase membrane anchor subunit